MTDEQKPEPQQHVVVFDCNVYLDVACLLGPPFAWDKFDRTAARISGDPLPHPDDRALDSIRAIAVCMSGRFAGRETVQVWTSAHIDKIVRGKAAQPAVRDPVTGYRGFGWSPECADRLVSDLIYGVTSASNGGTVGAHGTDGCPPLDHEDGMVYGACRSLASEYPLARTYCVTRDNGFLADAHERRSRSHTLVLHPAAFVALVRRARAQRSMRQMRP